MLTSEQKKLIEKINDVKKGINYYDEQIFNNPNDDYIQVHFKRRRDTCKEQLKSLREELKKTLI